MLGQGTINASAKISEHLFRVQHFMGYRHDNL